MTTASTQDAKQCPECRAWVILPRKGRAAAYDAHIHREHPEGYRRMLAIRATMRDERWLDAEFVPEAR